MNRRLCLVSLLLLAWASLLWLKPAWDGTLINMGDASQHMEYVWLVPVLSILLLWTRRKTIPASVGSPAVLPALLFLIPAAGLLFFGLRGNQTRFLQASAVLLLLALPLMGGGRRLFAATWFPILLLAFVMPVGFLDNFTVPLRRASVAVTTVLLNGLGIGALQRGTAIVATSEPFFQLDVADPCSGIRSLVALFAGTAAYGFFALKRIGNRWLLFFSSIPIAFLGNILRLLLTAVTCHWINQSVGMQLHDNALFLVAPFYLVCVVGFGDWMKRREERQHAVRESSPLPDTDRSEVSEQVPALETMPHPGVNWNPSLASVIAIVSVAALMIGFRSWAGRMPALEYESDAFLNKTFQPIDGTVMRFPRFCQNRECLWSEEFAEDAIVPERCPRCGGPLERISRAEIDILPNDTQSKKVTYLLPSGDRFVVSLVIAGRDRMSIHRPELCLPAQGYAMSSRQVEEVLPGLPMALFSLTRGGQPRSSGFAYVFLYSGGATVSNIHRVVGDSLERSLYNRIQRWAMVTVTSPDSDFTQPEGLEALRRFMRVFYPRLRADTAKGPISVAKP